MIRNRILNNTATAFILAAALPVFGQVYPLTNSGFEDPDLASGTQPGITGWPGNDLQTAVAADVGLTATEGDQIAYNNSPDGTNFLMYQDTANLQTDTVYNLEFNAYPLVNDPSRNALAVELAPFPSFSGFYVNGYWNSVNLSPGSFPSTNTIDLIPQQWNRVIIGFNTGDFDSLVSGGQAMRIIIRGHKMAIDNVQLLVGSQDYYVSFSEGNDLNDGLTPATPWKTFTNLDGRALGPGDTVYLKRGDTWPNSELNLTGKGTVAEPITLTAYGDGPNPIITGQNLTDAACIVLENPSNFKVDSMDCRDAKIGLYLRYTGGQLDGTGPGFNNENVEITHCYFQNMDEVWSDGSGDITVQPPYELSWGAGIWIGGNIPSIPGTWAADTTTVVDGVTVKYCGFREVNTGVGSGFYFPTIYRSRIRNMIVEDCWSYGTENGGVSFFFVDGGHTKRFDALSGGLGYYADGTTNGFIQHSQNYTIDDCEFSNSTRPSASNDGIGFDIEGNCDSVAVTNTVMANSAGGAFLLLDSAGSNSNLTIEDNVFYNNCRDAKESGQNWEARNFDGSVTGTFRNNGIYRGADAGIGQPGFLRDLTDWQNMEPSVTTLNRLLEYSSVSGRATSWSFNTGGDFEGWNPVNQLTGAAVSGGTLNATSSGTDPFIEGPDTWVNARANEYVLVTMSVNAGTNGQIFFQRETDQTWDGAKSVTFPLIADGTMHTYRVDMRDSAEWAGVATKLRIDPTDASGASIAIDSIIPASDPAVGTVTANSNTEVDVVFSELLDPLGGALNPANYTITGTGSRAVASNPDTVTLIPDASGQVFRLKWDTGSMDLPTATLEFNNIQDYRGNAIAAGSTTTFNTVPGNASTGDWTIF